MPRYAHIKQFPHCDPRVLHRKHSCRFCDLHPEWQELREAWGIPFTGEDPIDDQVPEPATYARSLMKVERWHGNRSYPPTEGE